MIRLTAVAEAILAITASQALILTDQTRHLPMQNNMTYISIKREIQALK